VVGEIFKICSVRSFLDGNLLWWWHFQGYLPGLDFKLFVCSLNKSAEKGIRCEVTESLDSSKAIHTEEQG
jgi:hypothetical protein